MISPILQVPIVFIIFTALILSILTSISVPIIHVLPIAKANFSNATSPVMIQTPISTRNNQPLQEIRFGLWGICYYNQVRVRNSNGTSLNGTCITGTLGDPYNGTLVDSKESPPTNLPQSLITRGLAFEPVGTVVIFVLLLFSLFIRRDTEVRVAISFWISVVAGILTLATLGLNTAILVKIHNELNLVQAQTTPGTSIWLNTATAILILFAAILLFLGSRQGDKTRRRVTTVVEELGRK